LRSTIVYLRSKPLPARVTLDRKRRTPAGSDKDDEEEDDPTFSPDHNGKDQGSTNNDAADNGNPFEELAMMLDLARDRRIYSDLLNSHLVYSCLYGGEISSELEVSAPHLVQLEYEDRATRGLLERAWGRSWGTYLQCDMRMERLRRHLRTLLVVKSWSGERMLFR
jgi:hypothetical protein